MSCNFDQEGKDDDEEEEEVNDAEDDGDGEDNGDVDDDVKEDKALVVEAGEVLAPPVVEAVEGTRGAGQVLRAAGGWRRVS